MGTRMSLVVHPTYSCDAECDYCSVHKLGKFVKPMSQETLKLLIKRTNQFFETKEKDDSGVTFYWLGGEALLVGDAFYEDVEKTIDDSLMNKKISVTHQLQTNLLKFTNNDFTSLKRLLSSKNDKNKSKIYNLSTSYDPVSDARKYRGSSAEYNKLFAKSFKKVKDENGRVSMVYTAHSGSMDKAKEIYYFIKNAGFSGFNINSILDFQGEFSEEDFQMTTKQYGDFLIQMWELWESDNYKLGLTPFIGWKKIVDSGDESDLRCHNDGRCSYSMFSIGPDGSIHHCNFAQQAYEKPLGTLKNNTFEELSGPKRKNIDDRIEYLENTACQGCRWWSYCRGGCPYEGKGHYEGRFDKTYWCESYKMLFEYINRDKVY